MTSLVLGLVGNPNCGKTTLFNGLTGARQTVGNWPGVTVERKSGTYAYENAKVTVVDLPGVYSLGAASDASVDESLARDYILSGEADVFVNIIDASNLERNLYLTAQLLEMNVPLIVALNMMDIAKERRIQIDHDALSHGLGCPVVPLVASRKEGLEHLKREIADTAGQETVANVQVGYDRQIEETIATILPTVAPIAEKHKLSPRWLAIKLLEGDAHAQRLSLGTAAEIVAQQQQRLEELSDEDTDILFADGRFGFASQLIASSVTRLGIVQRTLTDRIDRIVLHRLLGIPIFFAVMYLLFLFTINVGSAFIDFFDILVGTILVDGVAHVLQELAAPGWIVTVLASGVGGGIQTVATFIPVIACLYLFLSFLEDCGYMARAAFVMDRFMRFVGLPGKAFIPLIVGFGCNVPAIMATRTLENKRDRIITVMMAPFMSCGARLPVYALFAAAFFPVGGQNLVFALYLIGIVFAVLTGLVLRNTLLAGETAPFVMELPPYHLPTLKGIVLRTWERLKSFVIRAGRVIVLVVVVLSFLNALGTDGSFGNEDTDRSVLAAAGKAMTPIVEPMGITADNWPATVGMITGIFAKEAVVGTLDSLYGAIAQAEAADRAAPAFDLKAGVLKAFVSIPANLAALADALIDPLGLNIGDVSAPDIASEAQGVGIGTFGAMASRFDGQLGAFAYLLAVLLYMPCVAAMAAIYRETGAQWTIFAALWTTGLGYGAAILTYQVGTFSRNPLSATTWIGGVLFVLAVVLFLMRVVSQRDAGRRPVAIPAE
ncbi:MAG: Fe(2+) transporter permease subunit FeoB [Hyphomicrobiales bacterium]|nr:Fe(2+) transporter permease subunit FeoB [Hyphomicrobiales bacterium]